MGVVPQSDQLDGELTVEENLVMYGRYFDIPRAESRRRTAELLDFVQLTDRAKSRVEPLSGGMKRRVTIARSLINEPELLLLDEPTTGLDPQARHILWDRLYRLKQRGVTLVITTHYMDEAEQLCDRLVVMDRGQIVAEGSPRALIEQYSTREVLELRYPGGYQRGAIDRRRRHRRTDRGAARPGAHLRRRRRGGAQRGARPRQPSRERARAAQLARGRLPPPHRSLAGRMIDAAVTAMLSTPAPIRVWEHSFAIYRRIWRSNVLGGFVQPLLYLVGMGIGVGALVDSGANSLELLDGLSYFAFIAPALLATTAMMVSSQEAMWPVVEALHVVVLVPLDGGDSAHPGADRLRRSRSGRRPAPRSPVAASRPC